MVISGQVLWMKGCWAALAARNRRVGSLLDAGEARAVQGLLLATRVRSWLPGLRLLLLSCGL